MTTREIGLAGRALEGGGDARRLWPVGNGATHTHTLYNLRLFSWLLLGGSLAQLLGAIWPRDAQLERIGSDLSRLARNERRRRRRHINMLKQGCGPRASAVSSHSGRACCFCAGAHCSRSTVHQDASSLSSTRPILKVWSLRRTRDSRCIWLAG